MLLELNEYKYYNNINKMEFKILNKSYITYFHTEEEIKKLGCFIK